MIESLRKLTKFWEYINEILRKIFEKNLWSFVENLAVFWQKFGETLRKIWWSFEENVVNSWETFGEILRKIFGEILEENGWSFVENLWKILRKIW